MKSGTPAEALMDFTGGVHIYINLTEPPPDLWELMIRAEQNISMMGCGTPQGVSIYIPHKTTELTAEHQSISRLR